MQLANAIPISFSDKDFWLKLSSKSVAKSVGLFQTTLPSGGPLYIVSMHKNIRMIPFVRNKEELFSTTAQQASAQGKFQVVINGPTYGLTHAGKVDALMGNDPVSPTETIQQGQVIKNGVVLGGQQSSMFYVANYKGKNDKYEFGSGQAPTNADAALGNMGPLIINDLPYGPRNIFNPAKPGQIAKGEPSPANRKLLVQRSNTRFSHMLRTPDPVGKICIAHCRKEGQIAIVIQPNGTPGANLSVLRDLLIQVGFNSAVYLDGSDSVFLMMNNHILIPQGSNKNETNITGIGFAY